MRILILSIKAGAGHLRAAEAVEQALAEHHPEAEVRHEDALAYTNPAFRKSFTKGYETLAKELPSVWGLLYESMEESAPTSRTKRIANLFDRLNARPLTKLVESYDPDVIVCTHYVPAEVLAPRRRKGKLRAPVFVTLTDYDIHAMWIQEGVDHYCVASEEMAYALRATGVDEAAVHVTGIPILGEFAATYPEPADLRKRLGLRPEPTTVLMSAGGFGLIRVDEMARVLAERVEDVQFLAVAGRNEGIRAALERAAEACPGKIVPYGFVDNMHELMAASDFAVAKSGGLTTSECLAMGLPMVVVKPIPGQEERNADYLLENGAGLRAYTSAHMMYKVERLLRNPDRLAQLREHARRLARPRAAVDIADLVIAAGAAVPGASSDDPAP